jgi:hypothetical protein
MRGPLRRGGAAPQDSQALRIEGMQDIADGLIVAAQGLGNHPGRLAPGTGQQELTPAQHKRIG